MNTKQIFGKHYRRLLTEGILKSVIAGVAFAFAVNAVFAFLYWMLNFGAVWLGAVIGLPLGAAFGILMYFLRYRLTEKTLARRIDRYGLEERMITMLELKDDNSCVAELQRADAIGSLSGVPAGSIKLKISAWLIAIVSATVTASLFLGVLGVLARGGKIPYGKDMLARGADGTFEIVYTVDGGGSIRGEQNQSVSFGGSTLAVRAMADDGWMFIGWNDGETSPERSEENVGSDMVIKAIFEKIDNKSQDDDDSDSADDLPYGSVIEESGGGNSDELGGENIKDDGDGSGGGKWQDRNQFIDGSTYYRDYLEFYYQYATGIFESDTDIPPEIIEFFETYFSGI